MDYLHCCHVVIGGLFLLLSCCNWSTIFIVVMLKSWTIFIVVMVDDVHCCHVVIGGRFSLLSCCNWWTIFIVVML